MAEEQSMINMEHLQAVYDAGNYQECLEAADLFLLFNPQHPESLLLKAKCAFQLSHEEESGNLLTTAYNGFEEVLRLDPDDEEALLYLAYINIYLQRTNLSESVGYCNRLETSTDPDISGKAIGYRLEAYLQLGNTDPALQDIDSLIKLNLESRGQNRSLTDYELALLYIKKGNLYLNYKNDPDSALKTYKEGFKYRHKDVQTYCLIANLAIDFQEYDFCGEVIQVALFMGDPDADEALIELYYRLDELTRRGILNQSVIYGMFIALRIFQEPLKFDTVEMLNFAQHYIKIYPDWFIPYHYAGAALYDAKSYQEAFPYLEKSMELGGLALGLPRLIEIVYRLTGELPEIEKWPEDSPVAYYNAGVNFYYITEAAISHPAIARELLQIRARFYKLSYDSFYAYFYQNAVRSDANEAHVFAMCCNNYGIALSGLGEYERAVEVHRTGYSLSPFWEQLYSMGSALLELHHYEESIDVLNQAITSGSEYFGFMDYIDLKSKVLEATFELGRKDETRELLNQVEQEYDHFIKSYGADLPENELFELSEKYIKVQNVRQDLLNEGSLEEANQVWKDQLAKNPDDNSSWFMLMQNYFQLKDYVQCIACAANYEAVKGKAITIESVRKVHFMRGMSYLHLENFVSARENLNILLNTYQPGDETEESVMSEVNGSLAACSYAMGQWEECMDFALAAIAFYDKNGWKWDEIRLKATLLYADACKAGGEIKAAIGTVNNILKTEPGNVEALKRKEEWKSGGLFSFLKF
ncbi:tetratricopeptide repeat protein [Pedobacter cryoconitis]|uniref:Tetratricopeptide (TPR) repeat protein n=1 Tax=Pedobacter cryoconitis TaxID=188932 RepID=A0A7X0J3X4_9SPHI|nr:tetratricopeptide repeat protein [Pedobacter cryoconitis]MBB6499196.1 tetratricopeptide (TPR) repeat protein [Pedobacter cryoconitis]